MVTGSILSSSLHPVDDELDEWNPRTAFEPGSWMGNGAVLVSAPRRTWRYRVSINVAIS